MRKCNNNCACAQSTVEPKKDQEQQQPNVTVIDSQTSISISNKINLRDDPTDWNAIIYFILGTIGFYLVSGPVTYLFAMDIWPNTDTASADF